MSDQHGAAAAGDVPQNTQDLTVFVSNEIHILMMFIDTIPQPHTSPAGPKLAAANGAWTDSREIIALVLNAFLSFFFTSYIISDVHFSNQGSKKCRTKLLTEVCCPHAAISLTARCAFVAELLCRFLLSPPRITPSVCHSSH